MDANELLDIIGKLQATQREWQTVDAKRELVLAQIGDKAEFVKDTIAMANNGRRSHILVGLEDQTFRPVGRLGRHFSQNNINQMLEGKIDPPLTVNYQEFTVDDNEYAVVEIVGTNPPYIVASDLVRQKEDRKQARIYKGTIYVRHEDRTEGISRSELDQMLRTPLRREFEGETERALELALEQPPSWEHLLTVELLRRGITEVMRAFSDLERGLIFQRTTRMQKVEFLNWLLSRITDLDLLVRLLAVAVSEAIPQAWGAPGEPGDPLEIKRAVDTLMRGCSELVAWEADIRTVTPPDPFVPLKQMMAGWTAQLIEQIERLPAELLKPFEDPQASGQIVINLVFEAPPNVDEVMTEIKRLMDHPEEWQDLA